MSDNLFDQLFELFQSPGPVNWKLAREVMKSMVGAAEPIDPRLAEEYRELALAAQLRIETRSELATPAASDLNPVDRRTWAEDNEQSFRYLIEPLADKIGMPAEGASGENPLEAMLAPLGPAILGMQAGSMIGFMSQKVLGQFDTGLPALDHDRPTIVVPNVEAFASEHGLDVRQVRLWATIREVTHHAQLGVPWVRGRFIAAMNEFYATVRFDPSGLTETLSNLEDPSKIQEMFSGPGGMSALLGEEHDETKLAAVQSLAAFLEGYADYVVEAVAGDLLPQLGRIAEAHRARREEPDQSEATLEQLVGLEIDRTLAGDAAAFCAEVERRWGTDALTSLWDAPNDVPTLGELKDPTGWAARVLIDDMFDESGFGDEPD